MGLENMKKYSIVDKIQKLKSLQEGKVVDVSEDVDIQTSEVSTELPKNAKVEKEDKQSFEDYKTMYKDVITQKCIEDYGTEMDKQLWEDIAKELYLKSKTYIPTGEEKPEEVLDKKEEGYSNIRQISQAEKILLDIIKSVGDYSLQDVVCETTQTGDIHIMTKDGRDITTVDRSIFAIDGDDTELIDELREDGYWKEDFDESKNLKEDLSDKSKFLIHILNGVISDIQDKYNVTATAEFDTENTDNVVVTLKGNTLDLIDATSYLAKSIRRDDVDFNFDDTIKDNTVKCTISPKTKMESKVEDFSPEEKDIGEDFINFCDDLNLDNNSEEAKEKYLKQYTINEVEMNGIKGLENKLKMVRNAINYPKNKKVENNTNLEYNYMLLDRLKQDCEYFLGNGNGNAEHSLWAKDIDEQIDKMKELYNSFAYNQKPEWITMEDINNYEKEMKELKKGKEKKTEGVTDLQTIQDIEEYINNIKDEHTKSILHHILEDEKSKENPSIGYLTMAIRKVLDIEQERNKEKKTESMPDDWYNAMYDKYVPNTGEASTIGGEILRTFSGISRMFYQNGDKIWRGNMKNNSYVLDPLADKLDDLLPQEGKDLMSIMANSTTDNAYEKRLNALEDYVYNYLKDNDNLFGDDKIQESHTNNQIRDKEALVEDINNEYSSLPIGNITITVSEQPNNSVYLEIQDKNNTTISDMFIKTQIQTIVNFLNRLLSDNKNKPVKESAISNYSLSEINKVLSSNGNDFTIKIVNSNEDVETKTLNIDREDLISIYNVLGGNKDELTESRPDKQAARDKMFRDSKIKLKLPNKFKNIDEIVSYLEKCDNKTDVMNVNVAVGGFNRQLHNDMLQFVDDFIKENGYLDTYIDEDGKEQPGKFKEFKQAMIDFVKNYDLKTESKEVKTEGTNLKRIARYNEFDNGYVLHNDWKKISDEEAEELAKQASIKDPTDVYYVQFDDIMNSSNNNRWYKGKLYTVDEINTIRRKEKEDLLKKVQQEKDSKTESKEGYQDKCCMCGTSNLNGCYSVLDEEGNVGSVCVDCGKKYSLPEIEKKINSDMKSESKVNLKEDQYEYNRRKGRPNVKKIAEDEYYDNQDWYIQHIKDYDNEEDFIKKEIAEIAEEYNLKENTARSVCKEIYKLAKENNLI